MSKPESPSRNQQMSAGVLPRPRHGHQPSGPSLADRGGHAVEAIDPHPAWLKKWRSLRTGLEGMRGSKGSAETVRDLQDKIAHTPAGTLIGLQAQAELISELAWNDIVAATARQLIAGIKRLQRAESR